MFLELMFRLRAQGVPVSAQAWLALMEALKQGLHASSLTGFYQVARCVLVGSEVHYDAFDRAFSDTFAGVEADERALLSDIESWLKDPHKLVELDPATRAALAGLDLEQLREQLLERLRQQRERHDGGNRFIGTGGTSAFGQGGMHPTGVRFGAGGGRSAVAVAEARRFAALRSDRVLDTRQIASALRRLRHMRRAGAADQLDLDQTVDLTARSCGDLELVWRPPRDNALRVLLLIDVGGSMDPHVAPVERLFSAAQRGGNFKALKVLFFHNCVYSKLYENEAFSRTVATSDVLALDPEWRLLMVGDAYMHPVELSMSGGDIWNYGPGVSGLTWLARLAARFPHAAWLNPEPRDLWGAPTIAEIAHLFAMFPLSLEGIEAMVKHMQRTPTSERRERAHALQQEH